jgi:HicB family
MMTFKCKRIIDGKTYNTETATQIHGRSEEEGSFEKGDYLFQTRFGAFFLFHYFEFHGQGDHETIVPYTPDEARQWLEENASDEPEVIERLFGEMPEAGSGEIKFTLRLPESLRDRLAARAKANDQSLNAWMVKCLESCAADQSKKAIS